MSINAIFDVAGFTIALAGLAFEAVADAQLRRFKQTAPKGAICDRTRPALAEHLG